MEAPGAASPYAETLRPLLDRDGHAPEPDQVRAMPIVLRLEKAEPPARTPLLEAAAAAAVAVCLDGRTAPGGEWYQPVHDWLDVQIRKVSRRARGAHWRAVTGLAGHTVTRQGAQARALLPQRPEQLPHEVSRLQVGGTDLPPDEPGSAHAGEPLLLLNPHVPMTVGKAAAQVGHATMLLAAEALRTGRLERLRQWAGRGYACSVRIAGAEWQRHLAEESTVAVQDAGYTEIDPGTVTVLAQW